MLEEKFRALAFLRVLIPTALRTSLSSSSLLTNSQLREALTMELPTSGVHIYRDLGVPGFVKNESTPNKVVYSRTLA